MPGCVFPLVGAACGELRLLERVFWRWMAVDDAGCSMLDMKYARFDEVVIRRCARDKRIGYLHSDYYPTLRLRFSKNRKRGTWDVLHWDGWHRVGDYPELDCSTMLECLPRVVQQLRRGYTVFDGLVAAGAVTVGRGAGGRPTSAAR